MNTIVIEVSVIINGGIEREILNKSYSKYMK